MVFDWLNQLFGKKGDIQNIETEKKFEYNPPKSEHVTELWRYKVIGTIEDVALSPDGDYIAAGTDIVRLDLGGKKEWPELFFFNKNGDLLWSRNLDNFYMGARYYGVNNVFLGGSIIVEICHTPYTPSTVRCVSHHFDRKGTYEDYYLSSKTYGEWKYSKDNSSKKRTLKDDSYVEISKVDSGVSFFNKEKNHLWDFNPGGRVTCAVVSSDAPYMAIGCEFGKEPHTEDYIMLYLLQI